VLGQPIKGFSGHFDPSRDLYLNPAALTMPPNFSFGGAPIALPGVRSPARNSEDFTGKRLRSSDQNHPDV
jgi:hypothetical protein